MTIQKNSLFNLRCACHYFKCLGKLHCGTLIEKHREIETHQGKKTVKTKLCEVNKGKSGFQLQQSKNTTSYNSVYFPFHLPPIKRQWKYILEV